MRICLSTCQVVMGNIKRIVTIMQLYRNINHGVSERCLNSSKPGIVSLKSKGIKGYRDPALANGGRGAERHRRKARGTGSPKGCRVRPKFGFVFDYGAETDLIYGFGLVSATTKVQWH